LPPPPPLYPPSSPSYPPESPPPPSPPPPPPAPPPAECGCTVYLSGASAQQKDQIFCKKAETLEKVVCVPALYTYVKGFRKLPEAEKRLYTYCGRSDFEVCDNQFSPPAAPGLPPNKPAPPGMPGPSSPSPVPPSPPFSPGVAKAQLAGHPAGLPPAPPVSPGIMVSNIYCHNLKSDASCERKKNNGKCVIEKVYTKCAKTCGMQCSHTPHGVIVARRE